MSLQWRRAGWVRVAVLFVVLGGSLALTRTLGRVLLAAGLSLVALAVLGPLVTVELLAGAAILGRELLWPADPAAAHAVLRHRLRVDAAALADLTGFAQTLADLQRHAALTASRQAQGLGDDVEAALARLAARGALSAEVGTELVQLSARHLGRLHALTDALQAALVPLAARYDPRATPRLWLQLAVDRAQRRWQRRIST